MGERGEGWVCTAQHVSLRRTIHAHPGGRVAGGRARWSEARAVPLNTGHMRVSELQSSTVAAMPDGVVWRPRLRRHPSRWRERDRPLTISFDAPGRRCGRAASAHLPPRDRDAPGVARRGAGAQASPASTCSQTDLDLPSFSACRAKHSSARVWRDAEAAHDDDHSRHAESATLERRPHVRALSGWTDSRVDRDAFPPSV